MNLTLVSMSGRWCGQPSQKNLTDATPGLALPSKGMVEEIIAVLETLPLVAPEPGKTRRVPETEADSFRLQRHRMRSPAFRAPGMHLGWTPQGLDAILVFRTAALNRPFDREWHACREAA